MERLKKILLLGASSLLLFCFPAFAEELEASELPIEEVNKNIELVSDSREEAAEIDIDSLSSIISGPVKAPSLNPNSEFNLLGYYFKRLDNGYIEFGIYLNGSPDYIIVNRYIT